MKRQDCIGCEYYISSQPCIPENRNCQCFPYRNTPIEIIDTCPKADPNWERDYEEWCAEDETA